MYTTDPPPRNTSRRGWRDKRRAGDDDNVSKHLTSPLPNKTLSQILEFEVAPNLSGRYSKPPDNMSETTERKTEYQT